MKNNIFTGIFYFTLICNICAQPSFVKFYDFGESTTLNDFCITSDGGYLLYGKVYDSAYSAPDIYGRNIALLCKTDAAGEVIWVKNYTDSVFSISGVFIEPLNDGNYLIYDYLSELGWGSYSKIAIRKINIEGELIWENYYEDVSEIHYTVLPDDGYLAIWRIDGGMISLEKVDALGTTIWEYTLDSSDLAPYVNGIFPFADDIIISGYQGNYGGATSLIKISEAGVILDSFVFPQFWGEIEMVDEDNNIYIVGYESLPDSLWQPENKRILKISDALTLEWQLTFDEQYDGGYFNEMANIITTSSSNFMTPMSGSIFSGQNYDVKLWKFSASGDSLWSKDLELDSMFVPAAFNQAIGNLVGLSGIFYYDGYDEHDGFFMVMDTLGNLNKAKLEGRLYYDFNSNLVYDVDDYPIENHLVILDPGLYYTSSDVEGKFSITVYDSIAFQISTLAPEYFIQEYPLAPTYHLAEVTPALFDADTIHILDSLDFIFGAQTTLSDISIDLIGTPVVAGFTGIFNVTIKNKGVLPIDSGIVEVQIDPYFIFDSTDVDIYTIEDNVLTWNYFDLGVFETRLFHIYVTATIDPLAGETLTNIAIIEPIADDFFTEDNIDSLILDEYHSWDPNSKEVFPAGIGENGSIDPLTTSLEYTIHFQNTGNYPASFVRLIDTISAYLDYYSIQTISASHNYTMDYIFPNIVVWRFDDINLPDSTSDVLGSQGFVHFKINVNSDLPVGTVIQNTAAIYFDFNPPIVTNTVTSTLEIANVLTDADLPSTILIFPNPTNDYLFFMGLSDNRDYAISIYSVLGEEVISMKNKVKSGTSGIDVSQLPAGIYFYFIYENNNYLATGKFIKMKG